MTDDLLADLFHRCELAAFVEQARAQAGWPDPEPTRCLAYAFYEEALRAKKAAPAPETADCP